jgi:membrane associated rhomboid family serine protease
VPWLFTLLRWCAVTTVLVLLVIGAYAVYTMTPEERLKLVRWGERLVRLGAEAARGGRRQSDPFDDALRQRTPLPIVTSAMAFVIVTTFILMSLGAGALSEPESLVAWGASFGPRTTSGEWWRLATSTLVHAGFLQLLVSVVGLTQVGITTERMVGHTAFFVVCMAAGVFASLESLSANPMAVTTGAAGAIFGVYGLFAAALLWSGLDRSRAQDTQAALRREALGLNATTEAGEDRFEAAERLNPLPTISRQHLMTLAPPAAIFLLYYSVDGIQTSELAGLVAGFASGLILARRVTERKPPVFQAAAALAATAVIVAVSAALLPVVADVRPEIARVLELEDRTATAYEKAVAQFKKGGLSARALARIIDQTIVPELQAARDRLKTFTGVPPEHQPLVADANEYFRLRNESWRLRADALQKANMVALQAADRSERASLQALEKLRPLADN